MVYHIIFHSFLIFVILCHSHFLVNISLLVYTDERASKVAPVVKNPLVNAEDVREGVSSLGWEDPLEEGMAVHSSILAWRIPWTEEPGWLQSMASQRVEHDWSDLAQTRTLLQFNFFLNSFSNILVMIYCLSFTSFSKCCPVLILTRTQRLSLFTKMYLWFPCLSLLLAWHFFLSWSFFILLKYIHW